MRILNQKRGNILEVILPPIFQTIIPLTLVLIPLLIYTNSLADNKTFEKQFLAKETALTITTLASMPGDAILTYLPTITGFHIAVKQNSIEVFLEKDPTKASSHFYTPEHIKVIEKELYILEQNPKPLTFIKKGNNIELKEESKQENLNGITCSYKPEYTPKAKILIDPGHGGINQENADQGFSGNGLIESELTTTLTKLIKSELPNAQLTRETNHPISIEERIKKAENTPTIISIHIAQTSIKSYPIKIFFSTSSSKQTKDLACKIANALSNILDETAAAILPINPDSLNKEDPKQILLEGKTAILIELGNINNFKFINDYNQKKGEISHAIVKTIS